MFIWSALAHFIALTSPGPDTAIVLRQVSLYGRKEGYKTSIGIGIGIYIHCVLAVNGISLIIISNDLYKFLISLIGGTYILYLGISMLRSDLKEVPVIQDESLKNANSLLNGLITNIFNVKARLFENFSLFVALYLLSYAIVSANSIFNAALFGISKAKLASALIIFVSLLSILLTYEIAQHLHFSIYTLPLATLAAYTIGSLVAFLKLKQGATKQILFNCMSFRYCLCVIKDSGIPVFLSYLAIPVGIFIINYLLAQFGDNAIAGFSIAFRVQNFLILPAVAIGIASGIILNQVKKPNEANSASLIKHTLTFSILIYLPVSILVFVFNRELVSLFTTDHQVAVVAQKYLANLSLSYITFCPLLSLLSIWEQTGSAFKGLSINIGVLTLQILIAGAIAVYTNNLDRAGHSAGLFPLNSTLRYRSEADISKSPRYTLITQPW